MIRIGNIEYDELIWGPMTLVEDIGCAWQNVCSRFECMTWTADGKHIGPVLQIEENAAGTHYFRVCPKCGGSYNIYESHAEAVAAMKHPSERTHGDSDDVLEPTRDIAI